MNLLEMKNVKKSFGDLDVIKDISLSVGEGEIVSVIGPSGSGKSTLLRCATMLETMDSGELIYLGQKAGWTRCRRKSRLCSDKRAEKDSGKLRSGFPELQPVSALFCSEKCHGCADQCAEA